MAQVNHSDMANAGESSAIGLLVSFIMRALLPWAIHTAGALLSGAVVAISLFFLNRWLAKKFPKK